MSKKETYTISTKKGDKGTTSLLDGTRVTKDSIRPETYGTIDEANTFLGAFRAITKLTEVKEIVTIIQNHLYYINSELACPPDKLDLLKRKIEKKDLGYLDGTVKNLEGRLQLPRSFVLYGGTQSSSYADIARAVFRRTERRIIELHHEEPIENEWIAKYFNRLSDVLFLLARFEEHKAGVKPLHPGIE